MANANIPMGLQPVKYLNGTPWNGQMRWYYIPSTNGTALFSGDLVKLAGDTDSSGIFPTITQCAAGGGDAAPILGVAVAFRTDPPNSSPAALVGDATIPRLEYRTASTNCYVGVVDDYNVIFVAQEDSVGAATATADIGLNVNIIVAAGSTTTALSGVMIDSSSKATTNNLDCKLLGFAEGRYGGAVNTPASTNAKVLVLINNHQFRYGVAGL